MFRRMPVVAAAVALLVAVPSACGVHGRDDDQAASTSTSEPYVGMVCDLIAIPLEWMREDRTSFVEAVEDEDEEREGKGVGISVAFAVSARGADKAGRYRPVIDYLARRGAAISSSGRKRGPKLTEAIRENARALDRFLADGGCG